MSDDATLLRIERRQEALVQGMSGLADIVNVNNTLLVELIDWLKEPPSTEMADMIAALNAAVGEMREEIAKLPERVARAVLDGEV